MKTIATPLNPLHFRSFLHHSLLLRSFLSLALQSVRRKREWSEVEVTTRMRRLMKDFALIDNSLLLFSSNSSPSISLLSPPHTLSPNSNYFHSLYHPTSLRKQLGWGELDNSGLDQVTENTDLSEKSYFLQQILSENLLFHLLHSLILYKNPDYQLTLLVNKELVEELISWICFPVSGIMISYPLSNELQEQHHQIILVLHAIYLHYIPLRSFIYHIIVNNFTELELVAAKETQKLKRERERTLMRNRRALNRLKTHPKTTPPNPPSKKKLSKNKASEDSQSTKSTKPGISLSSLSSLLKLCASIIEGLAIPLNPIHLNMLLPCLCALHCIPGSVNEMTPVLGMYHKELLLCMEKAAQKSGDVCCLIVQFLINPSFWNETNSKHNVLLFTSLESVAQYLPNNQETLLKQLLEHIIKYGLNSANFAIAQRSLFLLLNEHIFQLLFSQPTTVGSKSMYSSYLVDLIVPVLFKIATDNFNQTTRFVSFQILQKLGEFNEKLMKNRIMVELIQHYHARDEKERKCILQKKKNEQKVLSGLNFTCFGLGKTLGSGSYSEVRHAKLIRSHSQQSYWSEYALKIMYKAHLSQQNYMENAVQEIEIMKKLNHPNIIGVKGHFEDETRMFLVLEYAENGDLFSVLEKNGTISLEWGTFVIAEVLNALEYLHQNNIVHLDIKPENVLLTGSGHAKLIDFGCSQYLSPNMETTALQGTAEYLSPEAIEGLPPTKMNDFWALGIMTYQVIIGETPFWEDTKHELFSSILHYSHSLLPFPFPSPLLIHPHLKLFLSLMLASAIEERLGWNGIEEIKEQEIFSGIEFSTLPTTTPPSQQQGTRAPQDIDFKHRQRKYSMLMTQALPRKYDYQSFSLPPIPEADEFVF
eukprot:CAMPEP_0174256538 /NCGR_PEP_ID=MMETSP0439-20130205/5758_1 /TAXON_ID=0 /ORGANISM="Stereomyxa ramosa, Strain Chinc5" /LENGTH=872 /DNA_ID=CAMNT_0015339183 /DNA_START=113 /DNA_END=2731 /DNA_ORIENTATION=+